MESAMTMAPTAGHADIAARRDSSTNAQRPAMTTLPQTLKIGPFRVKSFDAQALMSQIYRRLALGRHTELFFANTNFVVTCEGFAGRFNDPGITLVNDGVGMDLAARMVHGQRFHENLNGTDFIPRLLGG